MGHGELKIKNAHGDPLPTWALRREKTSYFAYFENGLGEQWVLVADPERVRLAGGDLGWEVLVLSKPDWSDASCFTTWLDDLVLNPAEKGWLVAALTAAAARFGMRTDAG